MNQAASTPGAAVQAPSPSLEDLLHEATDPVAEEQAAEIDPLDELLSESLAEVAEQRATKDARERLKRGGATATQRAEDEERIRRWEALHEWKAVANVAQFERHKCACGRQQTIFRQLMTRQVHRHLKVVRWQQAETTLADLPNEIVVQKWETPMCTYCADTRGFDFKTQSVKEWEGS